VEQDSEPQVTMGGCGSTPTAKPAIERPLQVTIVGAGEGEANGVYVETKKPHSGKPQFMKRIEADGQQSPGLALLWYSSEGNVWCIRKEGEGIASSNKLWYINTTGAPEQPTPPLDGWVVSAKANERRMGTASYSIAPAPTIVI
jgi:hypothetical protein